MLLKPIEESKLSLALFREFRSRRLITLFTALLALAVLAAACSNNSDEPDSNGSSRDNASAGNEVVLVTHNSFEISDELIALFKEETGNELVVQRGGSAVEVLNQAILTVKNPQGDVFFGVEDTSLSRALRNGLFEVYEPAASEQIQAGLVVDDEFHVTPISHGVVCVNYDKSWFADNDVAVPSGLADLVKPEYADLFVTPNPASSAPGLAFLTATVAEFGEDGWADYWRELKDNNVVVTSGWSDAYYGRFSGGAEDGDRPLVTSYGSSPPADVLGLDPLPDDTPTGVIESTCARETTFAGVLANAANPSGAEEFIDFLLGKAFQESLPLSMFVYPVIEDTPLPIEFERFAVNPANPYHLAPELLEAEADNWVEEWTNIMLR